MIKKPKNLIDWLIRGSDGRIHLVQIPNVPIIGWFAFMIVSNFATGLVQTGLSDLSVTFLAIWSYLEVTQGSSRARRVLGAAVAVFIIRSFFV